MMLVIATQIQASPNLTIPWKQLHRDIDFSLEKKSKKSYKENPSHYYANIDIENKNDVANLRPRLNNLLNMAHIINNDTHDTLVSDCADIDKDATCYKHRVYDYKAARKVLFGKIYLNQTLEKESTPYYFVKDQYCEKNFSNEDIFFDELLRIGPQLIPNPNVINTEHLWPKARFDKVSGMQQNYFYPYEMKLTDLHHLIPTDSRANGDRSSYNFGEVDQPTRQMKCDKVKLGTIDGLSEEDATTIFFEPPTAIKGDIARSLFYFSVKYEVPIDNIEEKFLRKWHNEDPVSEFERERNNIIHDIQGLRNPFIDYPTIEQDIKDF